MVAFLLFAGFLSIIVGVPAASADPAEINVPDDYPTIQAAIGVAKSGDTILVHPGTYTWTVNIVIQKSLTIKSVEGAENTILDFTGCKTNFRISINHSDVTIDGFKVVGRGDGHGNPKGAFVIRIKGQKEPTRNVSILNNVFIGISGIDLESAAGRISDITIAGNTIENCNYGIRVKGIGHKPSAEPIENVNIKNNNILKTYWPARSVRNLAEAPVNATMNWWGTTDGSEIEAMVLMDNGEITFDPWLDAPYPEGVAMTWPPTAYTPKGPMSASPMAVIRITADLKAIGAIENVIATLNIDGAFSFLVDYPENADMENFSTDETKTAEWMLATPLAENTYSYNVTWDYVGGSVTSDNASIDVTSVFVPPPLDWVATAMFIFPIVLMGIALAFDNPLFASFAGVVFIISGIYFIDTIWLLMIFIGLGIYLLITAVMSEGD